MPTIASIRDQLKIDAVVDSAESIADTTIDRWVTEALSEHNSAYAVDGSDLPAREIPLVEILAWIKLCNLRAANWATKNSLNNSQGYGNDRDTPFVKLSKQAIDLRKQYEQKCAAMGIVLGGTDAANSNTIVQGHVTVVDSDGDFRTPYTFDKTQLIAPKLELIGAAAQTSASVRWTPSKDNTFAEYTVFYLPGAVELFDETNYESSTGVPKIVDTAFLLSTIADYDNASLKIVGLSPATSYTFLVVARNRQFKYAYSNKLTITTAA